MEQNDPDFTNNIYRKDYKKRAGLFFFLLMIIEIPMAVGVGIVQSFFSADKGTLISVLMTQGYLLLAAFIYIFATGTRLNEDLGIKKYRLPSFFLSLILLICASPMANWLNIISQFFVKNRTSKAVFEITENVPAWLGVIIIGCLPGFVEETIYRGIIYSAFRRYSVMVGVIISALSFGLMHLNFNQMLYAIYLGTIFALLVEATGSLLSTMILHMLFNTVNTIYLYMLPILLNVLSQFGIEEAGTSIDEIIDKTPTNAELMSALMLFTPMAVVGLFLTVLLLKKIAQINGREITWKSVCEKKDVSTDKGPLNVWLILGWIICLIFSVINTMKM